MLEPDEQTHRDISRAEFGHENATPKEIIEKIGAGRYRIYVQAWIMLDVYNNSPRLGFPEPVKAPAPEVTVRWWEGLWLNKVLY